MISLSSLLLAGVGTATAIYFSRRSAADSYVQGLERRVAMCEAECQSCKQKQLICDQERGELRMENHDLMSRVLKLERQLERAGRSDDDDRDHDRDDEKT